MQDAEKRAAAGVVGPILHDVLNLLSAVATVAETASRQVPDGSPARRTLRELQELVAQGVETPKRLLEELEQHRPLELADLAVLVEQVSAVVQGAAGNAAVERKVPRDPLWVVIGPAALERILINLVVNARDAMDAGGRITIGLERAEFDGRQVAALEVADTGHGMDGHVRARAFDPYFTTKPGGHGLGLPTVRALAEEADGVVTLESSPGRGTKVRVLLPLMRSPSGSRFRREPGARLGYR